MIAIEAELVETDTTPDKHLEPFHKKHPEAKLDIACYNGPNHYVVAGSTVDIELLESYLNGKKSSGEKLRFKILRGMHAYHSVMADSIVDESAKLSASIPFQVSVETYLMKLQEVPVTDSLTLQSCPTCLSNQPLTLFLETGPNPPLRILPQGPLGRPWLQRDCPQHTRARVLRASHVAYRPPSRPVYVSRSWLRRPDHRHGA
mgnify:CR=1 FL=1